MNESIDMETIPELAPTFRFQWEEVQNCYVVLYPEGMVKLSQTAGHIMLRCDGTKKVSEIIDELQAEFPGAELSNDVINFVEQAKENGWIRNKSK